MFSVLFKGGLPFLGIILAVGCTPPSSFMPPQGEKSSAPKAQNSTDTPSSSGKVTNLPSDKPTTPAAKSAENAASMSDLSRALVFELTTGDPKKIASAFEFLGNLKDPDTVDDVIFALFNRSLDNDLRAKAATTLGDIGGNKAMTTLIQVLSSNEDAQIKQAAIVALTKTGDPKANAAIPLFFKIFEDESDQALLDAAALAYGKLGGDEAKHFIIAGFEHDNRPALKIAFLRAIHEMPTEDAETVLRGMATGSKEDPSVRPEAALTYGKVAGRRAVPEGLDLFTADPGRELDRIAGANILGESGQEDCFPGLQSRYSTEKQPAIKKAIAQAMAKLSVKDDKAFGSTMDTNQELFFMQPIMIPLTEIFALSPQVLSPSGKLLKEYATSNGLKVDLFFRNGSLGAVNYSVYPDNGSSKMYDNIRTFKQVKDDYAMISANIAVDSENLVLDGKLELAGVTWASISVEGPTIIGNNVQFSNGFGTRAAYGESIFGFTLDHFLNVNSPVIYFELHHFSDTSRGGKISFPVNTGILRNTLGRENIIVVETKKSS